MGTIKFKNTDEEISQVIRLGGNKKSDETAVTEKEPNIVLSEKEEVKKEAKILFEEKSLRAPNVKHYKISDGSFRAEIFNEPVHFYDESEGRFRSIDNTLCDCPACVDKSDDFDGYENKIGDVHVKFAKRVDDKVLFSVTSGNYGVKCSLYHDEFQTENYAQKNCNVVLPNADKPERKLSDEIRYNDAFTDTDLQYIFSSGRIKENIIVKQRHDKYEYKFLLKLKNLDVALSEDGQRLELFTTVIDEVSRDSSKKAIFTIPAPYMYDATNAVCQNAEYELEREGADYIFKVIADKKWINSEERKFPVTIDPVITINDDKITKIKTVNNKSDSVDDIVLCGFSSGEDFYEYLAGFIGVSTQDIPKISTGRVSSVLLSFNVNTGFFNENIISAFLIKKSNKDCSSVLTWNDAENRGEVIAYISREQIATGSFVVDITKFISGDSITLAIVPIGNVYEKNEKKDFVQILSNDINLIVNYTNSANIVSDKQQTNSVGRAGTGMLDLYTKNLIFVHNDITFGGEKMPLNISHIYNKKFASSMEIMASDHLCTTGIIGLGRGWKTNYHQYILPILDSSTSTEDVPIPQYGYIDQYGNETILAEVKVNTRKREIRDIAGKGLTYDETRRILKDNDGNKLYFDTRGRLIKMENAYGVATTITYNGNVISMVTDGAGRTAYFYYDWRGVSSTGSNGIPLLTEISCGYIHHLQFEYNEDFTLKKIVYRDKTFSLYEYGTEASCYYLSSIRDRSGYKISYSSNYRETLFTIRESTNVKTINNESVVNCDEIYGNEIEINYVGNRTYVKPKNGNRTVHVFNLSGVAYCSYEDNTRTIGYNVVKNIEYASTIDRGTFSVSSSEMRKNYVENGSFENYTACWNKIDDDGFCECATYPAAVEGFRSFKLTGEIDKIKFIYQSVTVPRDAQSLVLSAFAKAQSLPLNDSTKFRISAQIYYTNGTSEKEEFANFNYLEEGWQLAVVGLTRSAENRSKKISEVIIKGEYSNNTGDVYFDNFRLTTGTYVKQTFEPLDYRIGIGTNIYKLDRVSEIKYYKGTKAQTKSLTEEKLTSEDISAMLNQKISENNTGFVMVNGNCVSSEVNLSNSYTIKLVINAKEYDLFDCELLTSQKITMEDGTGRKYESETNFDGKVIETTLKTKKGIRFVSNYDYDRKGRLSLQTDFRGLRTLFSYNGYGALVEKICLSENSNLKSLISTCRYDGSGNLIREYDERGDIDCSTDYTYDQYGTLKSIDMPDGQSIDYRESDNHLSVSSPIGEETAANQIYAKCGLTTKITSNDSTFRFTYDGFGNVIKTELNGKVISETEYKHDSTYKSTDESTFNYVKHTYHNGSGKDYSEKTILDKDGNIVCVLGDRYDENGNKTTVEIMRAGYDEYGRAETITDKSLCNFDNASGAAGQAIVYNNIYSDDGELKRVNISGEISGSFSEITDDTGKVISKTVECFGEQKIYEYEYDNYFGNDYPDNRLNEVYLPDDTTVHYDYDEYSRLIKREITPYNSVSKVIESYAYLLGGEDLNCGCKDRETNYVSSIFCQSVGYSTTTSYTYDNRGNISSVTDEGEPTRYAYDELNRLTSENNLQTGILKRYEYDKNGNITKICKTCRGNIMEDFSFSYGADGRLIRLSKYSTSFSPKEYDISYDDVGNPCVYKDNVLKWERGRLLAKYGNNSYSYDADGVRIKKKTANGVLHKYFTEGTRIHHEEYGTHENWYYYDATGIVGIEHDGVRYYFQKNLQGDIARIFNANGYLVARYVYDAWGNHTVFDANSNINTDENFIGNINPFRYRGYYYDVETGLYYLNTRYYDPFACRFINADDISYIEPETINGLNLYSYCGNNPVMGVDPNGTAWWNWVIGGGMLVGGVIMCFVPGGQIFGAGLIVGGASSLLSEALDAAGVDGKTSSMIVSGLSIIAGAILCFTPLAGIGSSLLGEGILGIAGGYISEAFGGDFVTGAAIGGTIGSIAGGFAYRKITHYRLSKMTPHQKGLMGEKYVHAATWIKPHSMNSGTYRPDFVKDPKLVLIDAKNVASQSLSKQLTSYLTLGYKKNIIYVRLGTKISSELKNSPYIIRYFPW